MIDILRKTKYKIGLVACQYGFSDLIFEVVQVDHYPSHYEVLVGGLDNNLFTSKVFNQSEAQSKMDDLYDEVRLWLYNIKIELYITNIDPDFMEVDYNFDWEPIDAPYRSMTLYSVTTDNEQIEELIKERLKDNCIYNLKTI